MQEVKAAGGEIKLLPMEVLNEWHKSKHSHHLIDSWTLIIAQKSIRGNKVNNFTAYTCLEEHTQAEA